MFSEVSWGVIARFDGGDKYRKFFLNNVDKYAKLYGASTVTDKQNDVLYSYMEKAAKDKSETELNLSLALVDKYLKKDPEERKIFFRITYYTETREWGKQTAAIDDYVALDKYKNVDYMNTVSWGLFEKCDDQASLKKAVKWMEKVVKLEPKKYAYLDTYANLLFKTKYVKDAEAWANKAIEAGKISGDKTTSSEKLLEQIKKTK